MPASGDTETWLRPVRLIVRPSVFRDELIDIEVPAEGRTLAEILTGLPCEVPPHCGTAVWLNGHRIEEQHLALVKPKAGALINAAVLPRDQRTALLIGGSLLIAGAAAFAGPAAVGALGLTGAAATATGAAVTVGVAIAGTVALNALVPPPSPGDDNESESFERTSIGSISNRLNPYGTVPVVCGKRRVTPPMAGRPYSDVIGGRLHSVYLFAVSVGRVQITDPRFGETSVNDFEDLVYEDFSGSSADPFESITLYDRDIFDDRLNIQLIKDDGPVIRASATDAVKLKLIFHAPSGPYWTNNKGEFKSYDVDIDIHYRKVGASTWSQWLHDESLRNDGPSPKFWEFERTVTRGDYEVRVTRRTDDNDDLQKRNDVVFWLSLQTKQAARGVPLFPDDMALVAIRIRDQGSLGAFNCIAESYAPVYSGGVWQASEPTRNPASMFRRVLQCKAGYFTVGDSDLDLPSLGDWYSYCSTNDLKFDGVFETERTVREQLDQICSVGRASLDFVDGKYSVIIDQPSVLPVTAMLTPRTTQIGDVEIDYEPIPQVIRVRFADANNDWEPDERLVFDDGYDAQTADYGTAVVLDCINMITSKDLAWRYGRRWLAHRRLRRESVPLTVGLEHVMLRRGQKVLWQHWASLIGIASGRVTAVQTGGGGVTTGITIDNAVTMEVGNQYGVRLRSIVSSAATFVLRQVTLAAGTTRTLTFASSIPAGDGPAVGDVYAFGILNAETSEMIVLSRQPTLTGAGVLLTHAAPGIDAADSGPIPAWDPNITLSGKPVLAPAEPVVISIRVEPTALSDHPDVLRQVHLVIQLANRPLDKRPAPLLHIARGRKKNSGDNWRLDDYPGDSLTLKFGPVSDNATYEVQVQAIAIGRNGQTIPSTWSPVKTINVPKAEDTPATLARVHHLELLGQGNDAVFAGRSPTFSWTLSSGVGGVGLDEITGASNSFVEPTFGYYEVKIYGPSASGLRRIEKQNEPRYTYSFAKNLEDSITLNEALPASTLRVEVTLIDRFNHRSNTARLTVSNPAPDAPTGLSVVGGVGTVFVSINKPTDGDFAGIIVWASATSGFTPQAGNEVARTVGDIRASFNGVGTLYVRVAAYDEFRDDPSALNISTEVQVDTISADLTAQPTFQFDGLVFTPNSPAPSQVSWTAGQASVVDADGAVTIEAIAAGNATYGGTRLFLYYQRASGVIQSTTSLTTATGIDRAAVAVYQGGTSLADMTANRVKFSAADLILAGTVGAGTIATDHAIITAGAQIASAVIQTVHIGSAQITSAKINDLAVTTIKVNGKAINTAKLDDEAATSVRNAFSSGVQGIGASLEQVQDRIIATDNDGVVAIYFTVNIINNNCTSANIQARRGGTVLRESDVPMPGVGESASFTFFAVDTTPPTASDTTYSIWMDANNSDYDVSHRNLLVASHFR